MCAIPGRPEQSHHNYFWASLIRLLLLHCVRNPGRVRWCTKTVVTEGLANKLIPRDRKFSHFCCNGEVLIEKLVINTYLVFSEMGRVHVHSRRVDSGKEETTHDQQRQLHGQVVSDQPRLKAATAKEANKESAETGIAVNDRLSMTSGCSNATSCERHQAV